VVSDHSGSFRQSRIPRGTEFRSAGAAQPEPPKHAGNKSKLQFIRSEKSKLKYLDGHPSLEEFN